MKKTVALLSIFFILIYTVSPLKIFEVEETEKISLDIEIEDPDNDLLTITYEEPLNSSGEWQTTYGDAGLYNSSVTVSDGEDAATETIRIIVNKKEESPTIESFEPQDLILEVREGEEILFSVNATDLNEDELNYRWTVDGIFEGEGTEFSHEFDYSEQGQHSIVLVVSDGTSTAVQGWNVNVEDVDIDALFESIRDITVMENDAVSLDLPEFERYGLEYEINEPLGNDNLWQTGYEDAGEYEITVYVSGKGYERKKTVRLIVQNNDRAPEIVVTEKKWINENEEVEFMLQALDPDNDEVTFSVENLPENARFEGDTFVWTPDFDFVQKQGLLDNLLEKFRLLSKTQEVEFVAMSNELDVSKKVKITVRDINQPFKLDPIPTIVVQEGEEIVIEPRYLDPDNDKVEFEYSGFMITNHKQTQKGDAGQYNVKIEATDGYYKQNVFVNVVIENVNEAPVFSAIPTLRVKEGREVVLELDAKDPDGDNLEFSSEDLPRGAKINGNVFRWTPGHDITQSEREFAFTITSSDGQESVSQQAVIVVTQVNQAPVIEESSNTQIAFVGQTASFEINAVDIDGDELTYMWDFGLFDKHEGENVHNRKFVSKGEKEITVTVSDGIEEVSKTWKVEVI